MVAVGGGLGGCLVIVTCARSARGHDPIDRGRTRRRVGMVPNGAGFGSSISNATRIVCGVEWMHAEPWPRWWITSRITAGIARSSGRCPTCNLFVGGVITPKPAVRSSGGNGAHDMTERNAQWYRGARATRIDAYQQVLGRGSDPEGDAYLTYLQREQGWTGAQVREWLATSAEGRAYADRHAPPPRAAALPVLTTRPGSRYFHAADTGAIVDYREATAMGIFRIWLDSPGALDPLMDWYVDHGVTAIRVLCNLDSEYWRSRHRPNSYREGDRYFGQLVPFSEYAAAHGLYVRWCLFGGVEPFGAVPRWDTRPDVVSDHPEVVSAMHGFTTQAVETLRACPNVLFEVANEPSQIGFGYDSRVIVELGDHVHELAPDRLMNYGAPCDEDNIFYMGGKAQFFDEHLRRMREADYLMSVKRLIEHTQVDRDDMPIVSGEWMNLGHQSARDSRALDGTASTATAMATGAMCRLKKVIPSFHAAPLLFGDMSDPATSACASAWGRALDLIRIDIGGRGCNGHWDCSPVARECFPDSEDVADHPGPVRVFGRTGGREGYIGVSIREPSGYDLPVKRPIQTLALERWGRWQTRIFKAAAA